MTQPLPVTGPAAERLLRADYTILVTDQNLTVLGDPIHDWSSLQATLRWKEPGSGQIVVPAHRYIREQLVPGCRIVVLRRVLGRQQILLAGPMEQYLRERADDGQNGGVGVMTVSFADDLAWLAARLAYPDPTKLPKNQTTDYWTYTGNPEAGMLQLVNTQAGPAALAARRVPKLQVAPFSGLSGTGTVALGPTSDVAPRERLERLTDVLRRMCTLGVGTGHADSLGFRIRQTHDANGADILLFEPVRARNLAGEVHFSFSMGNLKYFSYQMNAPTLTHSIVGGQGEGADRYIDEFPTTDPAQLAWGRWDGYVARPGTSPVAELRSAATEALTEAGQSGRLASNAADTVDQRFAVHYGVGDLVSLELDVSEIITAPVQTVNLQAWPAAGEVVGTTIGDQASRYESAWIREMRQMDLRVGRLERTALAVV
ncbi:Gp37-like protein [Actinoplanes xinjiangensis]|uniref:Gp37-like protein n=1 Tax=Actinoplanes xinjiangensis TaxID=512350 RepID=UPI00344AE2AC